MEPPFRFVFWNTFLAATPNLQGREAFLLRRAGSIDTEEEIKLESHAGRAPLLHLGAGHRARWIHPLRPAAAAASRRAQEARGHSHARHHGAAYHTDAHQ